MIETLEKEINGAMYSVTQLPARRALRLQAKLIKLFGAAASQLFVGTANQSDEYLVKAIQALVCELDDKTFDQFVMEMLQGVRKNGMELKPEVVDMEFAGNLNDLYFLLKFVLEVNFGDFLAEGGIIRQLISLSPPPEPKKV